MRLRLIMEQEPNNGLKFSKEQRSSFPYWFAHWCAFQMTALNLHIWKPKYLLHDIFKPWHMLFVKDYAKVQEWHRRHNNHHVEYLLGRPITIDKTKYKTLYELMSQYLDIDAMIIDNECSRFTKAEAPLTAIEFFEEQMNSNETNPLAYLAYSAALERAKELGLTE